MTPMHARTRARVVGALLLVIVFAAGAAAGLALGQRRANGITVNVRMTTELPTELRRLDPSPAQSDSLRVILRNGNRRMAEVLHTFEPRLRATIDSVDEQVRAVLTPEQRARYDAARQRRTEERIEVDTVRK